MKITKTPAAIKAATVEDIMKRRDEYDAETKKFQDAYDEQYAAFNEAKYNQEKEMERILADKIGSTPLNLQIRADYWGRLLGNGDEPSWEFRIQCNENNKFDDNVALAWSWDVGFGSDGEVKKDSSSWSGLKAVTPEQVADLEESVRIIKILNNMDWEELLKTPQAKYNDFVDNDNYAALQSRKRERPDFEKELADARLAELIGKDVLVELDNDQYYSGRVGILLTGITDKFLKGYIVPLSWANGKSAEQVKAYAYEDRKTSKSNLVKKNGMPVEYPLAAQ